MSEIKDSASVKVVLDNLQENPHCPHGPTLLFKRIFNGAERSFFACSACRDRKDCGFFLWADGKMTPTKKKAWDLERERIIPKINHPEQYKKYNMLLKMSSERRAFCHTCNNLLLISEVAESHKEHDVQVGISNHLLKHPSELLKPLESAKKEAQYLFTPHASRTIINIASDLGATRLLCLGTPRVHELVCSQLSTQMSSLLLDIDHRYHMFNSPKQFCWFNSFNNYFFSKEEGLRVLSEFLEENGGGDIVLVMDPPFGGRVEPLAKTIQDIMQLHRRLCPGLCKDMLVLWIFPYFMEPQILASCPDFTMLDYKVDYENHSLFASGPQGRKHGSPVRIFTNANPEDISLPEDEGYWFCNICRRWVSEENKHCMKCNECTSKDGRTYVHCDECKRCVKPTWEHCGTCNRCCLPSHKCGEFVPSQLCFNCGQPGHKKHDCSTFSIGAAITVKKDCSTQIQTVRARKRRRPNTTDLMCGGRGKQISATDFNKRQKLKTVHNKKPKQDLKKVIKKKSKLRTKMKKKLQL